MENPELVVIPPTPISPPAEPRYPRRLLHETTSTDDDSSSPSTSSQAQSSPGGFRSSSEDTAVTIFSMYSDGREAWAAKTKVVALGGIESAVFPPPRAKQQQQGVDSLDSGDQRRPPDNASRSSMPEASSSANAKIGPAVGNGHAVVAAAPDVRHSAAASSIRSSLYRSSEEYLPYARRTLPASEQRAPPPIPPKSPQRPRTPRVSVHRSLPTLKPPTINTSSPASRDPSPSTSNVSIPNHPSSSRASEGEDSDSFHVRSTYARLDVTGVRGDGYEEGVELTRAKEGGTTYLTSQPHELGRGPGSDVAPEELAVLASLDRYGFIVATSASSDRLVLLPQTPLSKPLSPLRPLSRPSSFPPSPPPLPTLPPAELAGVSRGKEFSRAAKWRRMLESDSRDGSGNVLSWHVVPRKARKLRERVYKGIPDMWRAAAWMVLIERFASTTRVSHDQLAQEYRDTLEKPSSHDIQIDLDVPRTISGHVMFRTRYGVGQRALFHVLHALSLHCSDCGYVQGMGPIAATLLCYYEPEKVYTILAHVHGAYAMHSVFSPGFPGLLESIYVQERVMQRMLPDVYSAMKKHNISSTSYTTKWYITLFANTVPFQTQLRLWDAFFLEGRDLIVIIAIAVLWVFKDQLTSESATFETILSLLSSFFVPESEDALMRWIERALGDKKLRADMHSWREEWKRLVAQGQDNTALL